VDLNTIANLATAVAVLTGLVFGIFQIGHAQRKRRDLAAIEAAHGFLTPELREALRRVLSLPLPVDAERLRGTPQLADDAEVIVYSGEAFGVMVFEGALPLHTLDRLMGGFLRGAWQRLQPHVAAERQVRGLHYAEWYQWLVDRMEEFPAPGKKVGAYDAHRSWTP
jgi:hypothetical protein